MVDCLIPHFGQSSYIVGKGCGYGVEKANGKNFVYINHGISVPGPVTWQIVHGKGGGLGVTRIPSLRAWRTGAPKGTCVSHSE